MLTSIVTKKFLSASFQRTVVPHEHSKSGQSLAELFYDLGGQKEICNKRTYRTHDGERKVAVG